MSTIYLAQGSAVPVPYTTEDGESFIPMVGLASGGVATTAAFAQLTGNVTSGVKYLDDFSFDPAEIAKATVAMIGVANNPVRFTYFASGADPSATNGYYIGVNDTFRVEGNANLAALRIVSVTNVAIVTITLES